jgi:hypothetical protein
MESQIWLKAEDKWAIIFMLRGHEVYRMRVSGMPLTFKRKVQGIVEALQQGQTPAEAGVKSVDVLDVRTIGKAELSPGNGSLTLEGEGEGAKKLSFSPADNSADQILHAILARSGRTFQPEQEEIGVIEALVPPVFLGALGGLFWAAVYQAAGEIAAGKTVAVKGFRRRGLQRLLITAAETLGPNGTIGLGVVLAVLVVGWAAMRIIRRPERTVWRPAAA